MADRTFDAFRQSVQAAARDVDQFRQGLRDAAREAASSVGSRGGDLVGSGSSGAAFGAASKVAAGEGLAAAAGGALAGGVAAAEATAIKAAIDEGVALLSVGVKQFFPEIVNAVKGIQDARNAQEQTVSLAQEMAAFGIQGSDQLLQEDFAANLGANQRATAARTRVEGLLGNESGIISAMNAWR